MARAIFYTHQTSGACAGRCACDRRHQMEKTGFGDHPKRGWLIKLSHILGKHCFTRMLHQKSKIAYFIHTDLSQNYIYIIYIYIYIYIFIYIIRNVSKWKTTGASFININSAKTLSIDKRSTSSLTRTHVHIILLRSLVSRYRALFWCERLHITRRVIFMDCQRIKI